MVRAAESARTYRLDLVGISMKNNVFFALFLTMVFLAVGCGRGLVAYDRYHNSATDAVIYVRVVDVETDEPVEAAKVSLQTIVPYWPGAKNNRQVTKTKVALTPTDADGRARLFQAKALSALVGVEKDGYRWVRPKNDSGIRIFPTWGFDRRRSYSTPTGKPTDSPETPYVLTMWRYTSRLTKVEAGPEHERQMVYVKAVDAETLKPLAGIKLQAKFGVVGPVKRVNGHGREFPYQGNIYVEEVTGVDGVARFFHSEAAKLTLEIREMRESGLHLLPGEPWSRSRKRVHTAWSLGDKRGAGSYPWPRATRDAPYVVRVSRDE